MFRSRQSFLQINENEVYKRFLLIRERLQQLVILFVHTWKQDEQGTIGDILLKLMKEAGMPKNLRNTILDITQSRTSVNSRKKLQQLSALDLAIINSVKRGRGKFKIGSAPVFLVFSSPEDKTSNLEMRLECAPDVKERNLRFFAAFDEALKEPPPKPPTASEKYLKAVL